MQELLSPKFNASTRKTIAEESKTSCFTSKDADVSAI